MSNSEVFLGLGDATGMAYIGPENTSLPAFPSQTPGASFVEIGAVGEDGVTLTLPSGEVIKNWAKKAERKINTENGKLKVPFIATNKKVLEAAFGSSFVEYLAATAQHGNVTSVKLSPDVGPDPKSFLFLMKDGDRLAMVGCEDGLVESIDDITFNGSTPVSWNFTIDVTFVLRFDDGQIASS